ncbi:MAG: hypothetical protein IJR54_03675 [Oscillibacter sp.]|nr:hypothetical protein [Oscillibacter sp.]
MSGEKTTVRRKSGALWLVIARGVLLSLVVWTCGAGLLAAVMMSGAVNEANGFPVLLGLTAAAGFAGALSVARHTPWGSLVSAALVAVLFTALLLCVGLLSWKRIAWTGHGGSLLLWAVVGGAAAGLLGRPRAKKRGRRSWR